MEFIEVATMFMVVHVAYDTLLATMARLDSTFTRGAVGIQGEWGVSFPGWVGSGAGSIHCGNVV